MHSPASRLSADRLRQLDRPGCGRRRHPGRPVHHGRRYGGVALGQRAARRNDQRCPALGCRVTGHVHVAVALDDGPVRPLLLHLDVQRDRLRIETPALQATRAQDRAASAAAIGNEPHRPRRTRQRYAARRIVHLDRHDRLAAIEVVGESGDPQRNPLHVRRDARD